MRPYWLVLAVALPRLAGNAAAGDVTRTLKAELTGADVARFGVENLAGLMRVTPGSGSNVVAVATIHAEDDALASSIRFERVTGEHGRPVLRVRYPLDRHTEYRYPGGNSEGGLLMGLFPGGHTDTKYDGERVRISGKRGVLLYADVEVQVPRSRIEATFHNGAGPMEAHDLTGELRFETGYGPVRLTRTAGDVVADTGSGDVEATGSQGALKCDTGSGECVVTGFDGDRLVCATGSGKVRVSSSSARSIEVDSGSGNVVLEDADAEELKVDTGSGNVDVQSPGKRLARVKADTGSGNVKLRLGADAGFEAHADIGSGDIVNHFTDAQAIVKRKEVVGYRRGDGRIRIDVDTGSGDLVLEPGK